MLVVLGAMVLAATVGTVAASAQEPPEFNGSALSCSARVGCGPLTWVTAPTMNEPTEGGRQEIERIMRKAEAMGEDSQRVATALGHTDRDPAELQAVEEVERQSWLRRLRAKRSHC